MAPGEGVSACAEKSKSGWPSVPSWSRSRRAKSASGPGNSPRAIRPSPSRSSRLRRGVPVVPRLCHRLLEPTFARAELAPLEDIDEHRHRFGRVRPDRLEALPTGDRPTGPRRSWRARAGPRAGLLTPARFESARSREPRPRAGYVGQEPSRKKMPRPLSRFVQAIFAHS